MEKFRKLGIKESILKSIEEHHFDEPSEIQEKAIPLILQGKDVIAGSATGSGKTLVFASIILQDSVKGQGLQSLILTPTKPLANQICNEIKECTTIEDHKKNRPAPNNSCQIHITCSR